MTKEDLVAANKFVLKEEGLDGHHMVVMEGIQWQSNLNQICISWTWGGLRCIILGVTLIPIEIRLIAYQDMI